MIFKNNAVSIIQLVRHRWTINVAIYRVFLFIYLFGGTSAILLSVFFKFNREQVGFAFMIGAILSLLLSKNLKSNNSFVIIGKDYFKISIIIWVYFLLFSIYLLTNSIKNYYLPLIYFITISFLSSIVVFQILFQRITKVRTYIILIEIFVLALTLSASFLFLFPGEYGNDSSFHVKYISDIFNSGNLLNKDGGQYQIYPVYHILYVEIMLLSNLDLKLATFILSIVQILFLLFIFIISNKLFNIKIGLLSTLLISNATNIIVPRYSFFPGSFSVIFFILFLYLILISNKFRLIFIIIDLFVSNFIHPLLPLIITFSLIIMYICQKIIKLNLLISLNLIFLSIGLLLVQWSRPIDNSYSIISNFISSAKAAFSEGSTITQATSSPFYNRIDVIMYELGFTILILLAVGGSLWFLKARMKENIIPAIVTLIFIPTPYILAVVYPNSIPARWFIYIEVVAGIFAGASIFMVLESLSKYKLKFLIFAPIFLLVFFSITSPTANPNSHIYAKALSGRNGLLESEISTVNFIKKERIDLKTLHGNSAYIEFIDRDIYKRENFIYPNISSSYNNGTILIRNDDMESGFIIPLFGNEGKLLEIYRPTDDFKNNLGRKNKNYDNGWVRIYYNI